MISPVLRTTFLYYIDKLRKDRLVFRFVKTLFQKGNANTILVHLELFLVLLDNGLSSFSKCSWKAMNYTSKFYIASIIFINEVFSLVLSLFDINLFR